MKYIRLGLEEGKKRLRFKDYSGLAAKLLEKVGIRANGRNRRIGSGYSRFVGFPRGMLQRRFSSVLMLLFAYL